MYKTRYIIQCQQDKQLLYKILYNMFSKENLKLSQDHLKETP